MWPYGGTAPVTARGETARGRQQQAARERRLLLNKKGGHGGIQSNNQEVSSQARRAPRLHTTRKVCRIRLRREGHPGLSRFRGRACEFSGGHSVCARGRAGRATTRGERETRGNEWPRGRADGHRTCYRCLADAAEGAGASQARRLPACLVPRQPIAPERASGGARRARHGRGVAVSPFSSRVRRRSWSPPCCFSARGRRLPSRRRACAFRTAWPCAALVTRS